MRDSCGRSSCPRCGRSPLCDDFNFPSRAALVAGLDRLADLLHGGSHVTTAGSRVLVLRLPRLPGALPAWALFAMSRNSFACLSSRKRPSIIASLPRTAQRRPPLRRAPDRSGRMLNRFHFRAVRPAAVRAPEAARQPRRSKPLNLLRALSTVSGMTLLSRGSPGSPAKPQGSRVRRRNADGRVRGGVPPAQHPAPAVRGGRLRAGVRADLRRVPPAPRGDDETRALVGRVGTLLAIVLLALTAHRRAGRAVARLRARVGIRANARQGRADRGDDPHRLSVSSFRLAGIARRAACSTSTGSFAIPAFTPVLLNVSIIGAALFLAPYCDPPIKALAWGVLDRRRRAARAADSTAARRSGC